ncbi:hypothetical protein tpqmel_0461 [Candidatus Gastranaerophilus sp. (ex Termes propinquus)]|nr:hypothetical protein tpqmel_0461 [Candidatus Gastranaerophilus sp. (ex Termes propinquus)]
MGNLSAVENIFNFLSLELTEDAYVFFLNVKKSFNGNLELFEEFISCYLTIQKNGEVPEDLYRDFVIFFDSMLQIQDENKLLEQFARYVKYFLMLHFEYAREIEVTQMISEINKRGLRGAYPLMMELLEDYETALIDENSFVCLVENILDIAENKGEKDFARFGLMINQMLYNNGTSEKTRSCG